MTWNELKDKVAHCIGVTFFIIGILAAIIGLVYTCTRGTREASPPVEESKIDSLIIANDKIILEVEHIDSIKDAKVIEVKSLDNDSTLRLFYQLIRK